MRDTLRNPTLWLVLGLIVVGAILYSFNLNNKLFWDDEDWILYNVNVHSLSLESVHAVFTQSTLGGLGLTSNYYRPVLFLTFAVNYAVSGEAPFTYHLVSNALHIASAVLLCFVLLVLTGSRGIAAGTALVFLIHPLQTEAVTYVSGRGDPLHLFFMLLVMFLFVLQNKGKISQSRWWTLLMAGVFVLALLSQEKAMILPFLLVLIWVVFFSTRRFWRAIGEGIKKVWPMFLVLGVYALLRLTVLNFDNTLNFYAVDNIYSQHISVRLLTFLHVLLIYYQLLFAPLGQHMERGVDIHIAFSGWELYVSSAILLGFLFLLWRLYQVKKRNAVIRSSTAPFAPFDVWLFGLGWFFIALGPVSGITPINAQIYEHWLYIPLIGPAFICVTYLAKALRALMAKNRMVTWTVACLALIVYGGFFARQTIARNQLWGDQIAFYEDILRYEPDSPRIHNNLGNAYFASGNVLEAKTHYLIAASGEDIFPQPHYNLGDIYYSEGDVYAALESYREALRVDPNFFYALQKMVEIYAAQGDIANAIESIEQLKTLKPNDPNVYYSAAKIYQHAEDRTHAVEDIRRAKSLIGQQTSQALVDEIESLFIELRAGA